MTARGVLSPADLLLAAHRLGAHTPGELISFLSVEEPELPEREVRHTALLGSPAQVAPPREEATGSAAVGGSGPLPGTPVAPRIVSEVPDTRRPGWWADAEPLPVTESPETVDVPDPPVPAGEARYAVTDVLRIPYRSAGVDVAKLLTRAGHAEPLTPLPMTDVWRTASAVEVLVDVGEGADVYRSDWRFLVGLVRSVVGRTNTLVQSFVGDPDRGIDPDPFTGTATAWCGPAPGSLVVLLSDLGVGGPALSPDRSTASAWRAVAERITAMSGRRPIVLTPFPSGRTPASLRNVMRVVDWHSLGNGGERRFDDR